MLWSASQPRVPSINHPRKVVYASTKKLNSCEMLQDTVVAIKQGGDNLTVANMDDKKYPTATFSLDPKQVGTHLLNSAAHDCKFDQEALFTSTSFGMAWLLFPTVMTMLIALVQKVDLENHTWANYFLAAYKVRHALVHCCPSMLWSMFLALTASTATHFWLSISQRALFDVKGLLVLALLCHKHCKIDCADWMYTGSF